jgi:hypothetical protein
VESVHIATISSNGKIYKEVAFESSYDAEKFLVCTAREVGVFSVSFDDLLFTSSCRKDIDVSIRTVELIKKKKDVQSV